MILRSFITATRWSMPLPHRMGVRLRGSSHLSKCHVLCWYDGLPSSTGSNQSGVPQWWTREKLSSASNARTRIKDEDLLEAPDDAAFLQSLRHSCARVSGVYPPLALVEAYITEEDSTLRVRRLHLIIVDMHRRRRMAHRVLKLLTDLQIDRCAGECLNTLPIPWKPNQEAYQLRYVFGYAMEGSDLPVLHRMAHSDSGTILLVH